MHQAGRGFAELRQGEVADDEHGERRGHHGQVEGGRGWKTPQGVDEAAVAPSSRQPTDADAFVEDQRAGHRVQQARDRSPGVEAVEPVNRDADDGSNREAEGDGEVHRCCADRLLSRGQGVGREDRQHGGGHAQGGQLEVGQIGR
ncbi:hypothetical protein D3C87_1276740 [compost metagenome]